MVIKHSFQKKGDEDINYIYKIINTITERVYIGKTNNPSQRKRKHFSLLRSGKHFNRYLQNSYFAHGEEVFLFEILKEISDEEDWEDVEKHYIKLHNSLIPNGYNVSEGGKGGSYSYTERNEKQKKSNQERVLNIYQIDMNSCEVINIFPSLREAERITGIDNASISRVCNRVVIHAGGYYWCREHEYQDWKPRIHIRSIPIAVILKGQVVSVIPSLREAEKFFRINRSVISNRIKNNEPIRTDSDYYGKIVSQEFYYKFRVFEGCID